MVRKSKRELENDNINIKKKITDMLELPKEVVLNLPLISMIGREEITIENYKGVIEYSEERVRIKTACGVIKIDGKNLFLKQITTENISISGTIASMSFI